MMDAKSKRRYRQRKKWIEFRLARLEEADYRCYLCGGKKKKGLQIHHIDPDTYGHERPEDVAVLCSSCHQELERLLHKKKLDIDEYVLRLRSLYDGKRID
jgi:5-methylcytosine-specific restriction endonuclease McrA